MEKSTYRLGHLRMGAYSFTKTKSMDPLKDEFDFSLSFHHINCNDHCSLDLTQEGIWRAAAAFAQALETR